MDLPCWMPYSIGTPTAHHHPRTHMTRGWALQHLCRNGPQGYLYHQNALFSELLNCEQEMFSNPGPSG